jgi:hypothetical protein
VEAVDEGELLKHISDLIGEQLFPEEFGVLMVDKQSGGLRLHSSYRGLPDKFQDILIPPGKGITGKAVMTGQPQRIGDVTQEDDFICFFPNVPIHSDYSVADQIRRASYRRDSTIKALNSMPTTEADQQLLITIAGQIAIAIDRMRTVV